jgi:hypothetical protein
MSSRGNSRFGRTILGIILAISVAAAVMLLVFLALDRTAWSRDLGQWRDSPPEIQAWFRSLLQPDTIGMGGSGTSCCGEGDGYWADEAHVRNGIVYAVITDDRPDGPRQHEEIGTEYQVPANKIVGEKQRVGNPTGHTLIFLAAPSYSQTHNRMKPRQVLCYVMNSGS